MKKRIILFGISFGLLAGLIYFSNPSKVLTTLLKANPFFILIGLILWFTNCTIRTLRWNYLLKKVDINVPFFSSMKIYIMGLFISNLSPAKTGDPVRAIFLKKSEGKSFSKSLPSIFMERIFDLIILIVIALIGLVTVLTSVRISLKWVFLAISIYLFLIIFGVYILISRKRTETLLNKIIGLFSFLPKINKLQKKVTYFSERTQKSIKKYKEVKTLSISLFLTSIIWILSALIAFVTFKAVGIHLPFELILSIKVIVLLLSILTFLPGSLGSGEVISVTLYSSLISAPISVITSAKILGRLVNFWIYIVLGAIFLAFFKGNKELELFE